MDNNLKSLDREIDVKDRRKETKNFICELCSKVLASKKSLKEHANVHNGVSPYLCSYKGCDLKFKQSSALSAHKKVHKAIEKIVNEDKDELLNVKFMKVKFVLEYRDLIGQDIGGDPIFSNEELKLPPIIRKGKEYLK